MINFTGSSKKRVVNLGDRKSHNLSNSKGFLERSKLQRQQREEQRLKDKNIRLIQQKVSKYVATRRHADHTYVQWTQMAVRDQHQFHIFVTEFNFLTKWKLIYDPGAIAPSLHLVHKYLSKYAVAPLCGRLLVQAFVQLVKRAPEADTTAKLVDLISLTVHKAQGPFSCQGLIAALAPLAARYGDTVDDVVMAVNVNDSYGAFLDFVADHKQLDPKYYPILRTVFHAPHFAATVTQLADSRKVALLVLFLSCQQAQFQLHDYEVVSQILATITLPVRALDTTEIDDSDDDSGTYINVDPAVFDKIRVLYDSTFIRNMFELFTGTDVVSSQLASKIMSALFQLVPEYKNRLCVLITITPGSYRSFFNQLKDDPIYTAITSMSSQGRDYMKLSDFKEVYSHLDEASITGFYKTLYTFEELYSYWLIVSNDFESFEHDKLSLEEVSSLLVFLKHLCLTLILNTGSRETEIFEDFTKLKNISISLLNQLYLKNLRLKFLPQGFWSLNEIVVNVNILLSIIKEQEEEKRLANEDSDEEFMESGPKKGKSKIAEENMAKWELLNKVPFFIKFNDRVVIFQSLIDQDWARTHTPFPFDTAIKGEIRREHVLEDAYHYFGKLGPSFKNRLGVSFYNQYGGLEAGIDGGGITKEFLNSVVAEGFDPQNSYQLFKETSDHQVYPNDEIFIKYAKGIDVDTAATQLDYLRFLGAIVGKCLYERVLIDVSFASFFLNKWCTARNLMKNSLNDLSSLDKELFQNLAKLTKMSDAELEALDLSFSVTVRLDKTNHQFDLTPNGDKIKVTRSNVLNYIHQMANFKLNTSVHAQSKRFLEGLSEIIPSNWLKMFDFNELQMLISGSESNIDIEDWKKNVVYSVYDEDRTTIRYFWEVVEEMDASERSKLVKFVTSVSRAPLLGFGALDPKFTIRHAGRSTDRLPTASTCVNLLKLPDYDDKELLREKLLYAINAKSFFDLS